MIAGFFAKIGAKAALIAGAIAAAVLALWGFGRSKKLEGRSEAVAAGQKKVIENVEKARKSEQATANADPDERQRLRDRYTRRK